MGKKVPENKNSGMIPNRNKVERLISFSRVTVNAVTRGLECQPGEYRRWDGEEGRAQIEGAERTEMRANTAGRR